MNEDKKREIINFAKRFDCACKRIKNSNKSIETVTHISASSAKFQISSSRVIYTGKNLSQQINPIGLLLDGIYTKHIFRSKTFALAMLIDNLPTQNKRVKINYDIVNCFCEGFVSRDNFRDIYKDRGYSEEFSVYFNLGRYFLAKHLNVNLPYKLSSEFQI